MTTTVTIFNTYQKRGIGMGCNCGCQTPTTQTPTVSQDELAQFIYNTIKTDDTDWKDVSEENKTGVMTLAQKLLDEYTITDNLGLGTPATEIQVPTFKPETIVP